MKKIKLAQIVPHLVAALLFFIVLVIFFKPLFLENKTLSQTDIQQWMGTARSLADHRATTGEEALWSPSAFSGMPAYMISVQWGNSVIGYMKRVLSLWTPHGANNILVAFVCYYIMLLSFRVRPYLAIAGALAFGLSSFMLIGLGAGHNARIGAMAFIPLVIAGIHLSFSGKRVLGFGVTAVALALHLRENHLQVTYYLLLIVLGYGLMQLIVAFREKKVGGVFKTVAILVPAALLAAGTFFGPLWAVSEYTPYSTRGKTELISPSHVNVGAGLNRDVVFNYSNGLLEQMTMLIPNFYGGSSADYLMYNKESATYKALVNSNNQQTIDTLARYTSPYWGEQPFTAPYYAGAVIVFLFIVGIIFAERKYMWWLVSISAIAIMLAWGKNFETLNYFLFDYLPGYNKFRSVTFILVIVFFSMPLLGLLGVEKFLEQGATSENKKKVLIAFGIGAGVCLLFVVFGGMMSFFKEVESTLPEWFANALRDDRKSMLKSDAFRSFIFITLIFSALYFNVQKRISPYFFYAFLTLLVVIDLVSVDTRYFPKELYKRNREAAFIARPSEQTILQDKSYFRVLSSESDGRASYFFNSLTGYNGAILKRYENLRDSCLYQDVQEFFADAQQQKINYAKYGIINMLNCKYIIYGEQANQFILNQGVSGPAWFVENVVTVNSPTEELAKVAEIDTRNTAVIDVSKFTKPEVVYDSAAKISLVTNYPNKMKYETETQTNGLAVFSEIYYPEGWTATMDGKEVSIIRVNYVLRALAIPAGKHTVEFTFAPKSYTVGNKITTASSWLLVLVLAGCIGWSLREKKE
jgi:hypothetical protein